MSDNMDLAWDDTEYAQCGECGSDLQEVRLGKWQCPTCETAEMLEDARRKGAEEFRLQVLTLKVRCPISAIPSGNYDLGWQDGQNALRLAIRRLDLVSNDEH